ncbi:T26F17.16 [Arabidopsis thaliana]|uniref:T26F17.16 n=1 Tax=Arabidopsis thaliana TaxID=3702 RepID=Q9SFE2_ARATH|nr:T26F17.16 [Arabidopsis thaliana]
MSVSSRSLRITTGANVSPSIDKPILIITTIKHISAILFSSDAQYNATCPFFVVSVRYEPSKPEARLQIPVKMASETARKKRSFTRRKPKCSQHKSKEINEKQIQSIRDGLTERSQVHSNGGRNSRHTTHPVTEQRRYAKKAIVRTTKIKPTSSCTSHSSRTFLICSSSTTIGATMILRITSIKARCAHKLNSIAQEYATCPVIVGFGSEPAAALLQTLVDSSSNTATTKRPFNLRSSSRPCHDSLHVAQQLLPWREILAGEKKNKILRRRL